MSSAYPEMEKRITTTEHMLAALIAGKLSRMQENMEDILTSNVFGLMQYMPAADALVPFLRNVEALSAEEFARARRRSWARLIKKVYEADPLICRRGSGPLKVISLIGDAPVIEKILRHLKLWDQPERPPPPPAPPPRFPLLSAHSQTLQLPAP